MNSVVLFARDPGGANCIATVYDRLRRIRSIKTYLWGKDFAIAKYKQEKLPYQEITSLKKIKPKLVLTGTSYGDYSEQQLWQKAHRLNIPSAAILDQWLNYRLRFTSPTGQFITPDHILIMDNFAKREMIKQGFPPDQLVVVGHPYLDYLRSKIKIKTHPHSHPHLLFISEPITQAKHLKLGYTEDTILSHLTQALSVLHQDVHLTIKFHPKHQPQPAKSAPLHQLILQSDLVIGMFSIGLLEAYILGKPVMSVQIGLNKPDEFILSRRGVTQTILSSEVLKTALNLFFTTGKVDYKKRFPIVSHARDNIINFVLDTVVKSKPYATASH